MKKNTISSIFLVTLLSAGAVRAQDVDLTGTVTGGAGGALLANVNVTLKKRTAVTTTTGADGTYHLTAAASVTAPLSGLNALPASRLRGTVLEFGVTGDNPVVVEVYSACGSKVATLMDQKHPAQGSYSLDLAAQNCAPSLYFIRYRQGIESTVYRYVPMNISRGPAESIKSSSTVAGGPRAGSLSKSAAAVAAAVDTLVFTLSGYVSAQIPISAYTGQYDAVLQPQAEGTAPVGMKAVPGGTFTMGNDNFDPDSKPAHQVTVSPFFIGIFETTQAAYKSVTGLAPSANAGDSMPLENVSWFDAVRYCIKKSAKEGLQNCYDTGAWTCDIAKNGYRLPTEAEWEYACRAGTTTAFYWGNTADGNYGWNYLNSGNKTHPVGQKLPNAWGLYDMVGNVWEWCYDWHGPYSSDSQTDPTGPATGSTRIIRGGGCWGDAGLRRSDLRGDINPVTLDGALGFRIVCR